MITSLGIEKFWEHINEIERNIDAGTSFPPYNIIRHDEENATVEFAVAGYKKDDIEIVDFKKSFFNDEKSAKASKHCAGRKFENKSISLRNLNRPRSGFTEKSKSSYLGPPTAPNKTASTS